MQLGQLAQLDTLLDALRLLDSEATALGSLNTILSRKTVDDIAKEIEATRCAAAAGGDRCPKRHEEG